MFFDRSLFINFTEKTQRKVKNATGTFLQVEGVGEASLLLLDKDRIKRSATFSDCLFLPDHSHNLISVSKVRQNGANVNFGQPLSVFVNGKQLFLLKSTLIFTFSKEKHLIFVFFPARTTKKHCCNNVNLVTTISKTRNVLLIIFLE